MSGSVVVVDLRGQDGPAALARTRNLLRDPDVRDLTQVLILDTAAEVVAHRDAFEELFSAHRVGSHLCVLTGRQPGRTTLELPKNIEKATLWLPDPAGVDWPYRAAAPAKVHPPSGSGLDRLVEIVRMPEVFRRTAEQVARVPYGVACPALGLADADGADLDDFPWALCAALRQMLTPSESALPPEGDDLTGRRATPGTVTLTPGGRLDRVTREAREAVEEAQRVAGELTEGVSFFGPARSIGPMLEDTATALGGVLAAFTSLMTAVRTREDPQQAAAEHGLVLPEGEDFTVAEVRAALDRSTRTWLRAPDVSLPRIDESLRQWARALGEDEGYLRRVRELLPDRLIEMLRAPVAFPGPQRWLPAVGAAVSALAATAPLGAVGGTLMALAWTALVALTVAGSPSSRAADHVPSLAANAAASLAGGLTVGLGGAALGTAGWPPVLWGPAVGAAVLVALVVALRAWKERAKRWIVEIGTDVLVRAADDLDALLARAAADWAGLDARATTQDALSRYQAAVDGVAEALSARLGRLDRELDGRPPRLETGYLSTVRRQLADLVAEALRPSLDGLAEHDLSAHARDAARRTETLLGQWTRHVEAHGAVEPPPFARDQDPSPAPDTSEELRRLTAAAALDPLGEMWQLCAADDLVALEVTPHELYTVAFGPRRGRPAFGRTVPADTVWVPALRAGVLRLTPLRSDTVIWTWNDEIDEPDLNGTQR